MGDPKIYAAQLREAAHPKLAPHPGRNSRRGFWRVSPVLEPDGEYKTSGQHHCFVLALASEFGMDVPNVSAATAHGWFS